MFNLFYAYQSFRYKTELFFFSCLLSVLLFYPSDTAMYLCAFILPVVFGGVRKGVPVGLAAVLLAWFISSHVMITEVKRSDGKNWLYTTTWGSLVAPPDYRPGDMLKGTFKKQKYAFVREGRFARGYYIAEKVDKVSRIAPAAYILKKREDISDRLYLLSGGRIFLSQALALGDKRYLPPDVRDAYTVTGLGHLLAVSGLHAGLYAGIVFALFSFLSVKMRMIPVMAAMLLLIPFTGFKVTVLRAGMLVFAVLGAKFADHHTDVRKLLLFMAGFFMLVSPSIAVDVSFILTFSAVYGLVHLSYSKSVMTGVYTGMVASAFIMPASSYVFGTFNVTSVLSTLALIPVVTLQIITTVLFVLFPSVSLEPLAALESVHLYIVNFAVGHTVHFFKLYKPDVWVILFMVIFLLYCAYKKRALAACVLLMVPYLPSQQTMPVKQTENTSVPVKAKAHGAYFPNMVRSKGFLVIDDKVHVFFKGNYGDFKYKFLPFLAKYEIIKADTGTVSIYDGENRLLHIDNVSEDYGGVCVNEVEKSCKAVYHTRSNTYECDDEGRTHILYNNKKQCGNMYLLKTSGDLSFDEDTYKRR